MPTFFFSYRSRDGVVAEPDEAELAGLDDAKRELEEGARGLISDRILHHSIITDRFFEVTDEDNQVVFSLDLVEFARSLVEKLFEV